MNNANLTSPHPRDSLLYTLSPINLVISKNVNNDRLEEYIKKSTSYEAFMKNIYNYFFKKYSIPKIEFLFNQYL